jgi:hypothetical protein
VETASLEIQKAVCGPEGVEVVEDVIDVLVSVANPSTAPWLLLFEALFTLTSALCKAPTEPPTPTLLATYECTQEEPVAYVPLPADALQVAVYAQSPYPPSVSVFQFAPPELAAVKLGFAQWGVDYPGGSGIAWIGREYRLTTASTLVDCPHTPDQLKSLRVQGEIGVVYQIYDLGVRPRS